MCIRDREEFHQERHENRSEFQRDYDRLVFSAPFRRLQNKTCLLYTSHWALAVIEQAIAYHKSVSTLEDQNPQMKNRVPLFSYIPLIGNLFKSQEKQREKVDLMIFLTPYILERFPINGM